MVHSSHCNITRKVLDETRAAPSPTRSTSPSSSSCRRTRWTPAAYFISNGTERVLITLEDLAPNRVLVEKATRYGTDVEIAKVFSQHEGYRALVVVERKKDGDLMVTVPSASGQIPLVVLLRALGMESDEEIVHAIQSDPQMEPLISATSSPPPRSTVSRPGRTPSATWASASPAARPRSTASKRVEALMDRNLLPHLGQEPEDRITKAIFLARMGQAVFELFLGLREEDDKDHYATSASSSQATSWRTCSASPSWRFARTSSTSSSAPTPATVT